MYEKEKADRRQKILITEEYLKQNLMISFYISFFSYAEIPKQFDRILGVTGTL